MPGGASRWKSELQRTKKLKGLPMHCGHRQKFAALTTARASGWLVLLTAVMLTGWTGNARAAESKPTPDEAINFALLDERGNYHELKRTQAKAVVVLFAINGCPIVRQNIPKLKALRKKYEGDVEFWLINSVDDRESVKKEAEEYGYRPLPTLVDETQDVGAFFKADRSGEVLAISARDWKVIYRGAVDDQYAEGAARPRAQHTYLADALSSFLAGKPIEEPVTVVRGCRISVDDPAEKLGRPVTYTQDVADILERRCQGCHSRGNIGPFAFSGYSKSRRMADMIEEVVLARRMPPWHADPLYGKFANDRSMTTQEARTLLAWVRAGAPRGEGEDPLAASSPVTAEWPMGKPECIVKLPKPQHVPATGVLDYRYLKVKSPLPDGAWLRGVAVHPDNRRVVHHIIVRVLQPGQENRYSAKDYFLVGWAPGTPEGFFPAGTGKQIKPGSILEFEMHYTTCGKAETDQSSIGLYLAKERPRVVLRTVGPLDFDLNIPPGEPDARTFAIAGFKRDTYLFDMAPHMHYRGRWFKYEALYPDGTREILLSVPNYDFNWQSTYRLEHPKLLPKGTWLLCTGGWDNSKINPSNPDPERRVHWGDQSFDEMFIGFVDVAEKVEGADLAGTANDPEREREAALPQN